MKNNASGLYSLENTHMHQLSWHSVSVRQTLFSSYFRWENWGFERWSYLCKSPHLKWVAGEDLQMKWLIFNAMNLLLYCSCLQSFTFSSFVRMEMWVHACMLSHFSYVLPFATLWTVARQAPLSMGFSRQEYWSGLPRPPSGDLPNPGSEPTSYISCTDLLGLYH